MDNKPLLIWLQGGPGVSSLFGMYTEIGPYKIVNDSGVLKPEIMDPDWNEKYHLMFVDQPIGVGWSP